jgi:hypothetical protein
MPKIDEFRPVNTLVGTALKIGGLSIGQMIPVAGFMCLIGWLTMIFNWPVWISGGAIGVFTGAIVLLLGQRPWLFFSRISRPPYWVRVGVPYKRLLPPRNRKP